MQRKKKEIKSSGCKDSASLLAQMVKNPPANAGHSGSTLGGEDALEEGLAAHPSTPAWRIPWTEEPGGLRSAGSHRVRHD